MTDQWFNQYSKFLKSEQWKMVRARILNYYGRKCFCCGTGYGKLQVHHLSYERYRNPPIGDVRVLCEDCHKGVTQITRSKRYKGALAVAAHKSNCQKRKKLR